MTALAERAWWDGLTDDDVPANMADAPVDGCLAEIVPALELHDAARVLDLGCGVGRLAIPFARRERVEIIGVDISQRMLDKIPQLPNLTLLLGDGRALPDVGPLDGAYSMFLFQHLPPEASAAYVREVAAHLTPGARFRYQIVVGPAEDSFLAHQCPDKSEPVSWATDAGLEIVTVEPSRLWHEWLWVTAVKP